MANQAGLKQWSHARTQTIELPSGSGHATVRLLTIGEAIYHDRIPNPLIGIALKAESGDLQDPTPEDAKQFLDLQCSIVASQLEKFKPKKGQGVSGPLDADWVRDEMPPRDREQLFAAITHIVPQKLIEGLLAASLSDLRPFRGGQGGADVPPDVQADEQEAE